MPGLCYRKNVDAVIERRKQFNDGKFKNRILFAASGLRQYPDGQSPKNVRIDLRLPRPGSPLDGPVPVEDVLPILDHNHRLMRHVTDDELPISELLGCFGHGVVCEAMGYPVHHFVVGGYGSGSTVVEHAKDLDGLMDMELQWDLPVMREIERYLRTGKEYAAGRFFLDPYMAQDGLHLMTNMLGYEKAYMTLYERPDDAHAFCRKAVRIARDFYQFQTDTIGQVAGGWVLSRSDWNARPCISLNLDDYLCCSNEIFQEFGVPYLQQLIDHFGSGMIHFHTPDTRLLKDVARMRNILIQVGSDPKLPDPIDCLSEIRETTGDIPLTWMRIRRDRFEAMLRRGELPGNVEYLVSGIHDSDDANRLYHMAIAYEAPDFKRGE